MDRTLVLARHAKSAWPVGTQDSKRPLSARGQRDAPAAGKWLADRGLRPDVVAVSPSVRTRATWGLMNSALRVDPDHVSVDPRIYLATWWDLLDVVREFPATARVTMLVGHNPGIEDLASQLAGDGKPSALRSLRSKFPTNAIAVLKASGEWDELGAEAWVLTECVAPRG